MRRAARRSMDCFVAIASRNDEYTVILDGAKR
jgi:hypothetical protein